MKCHIDICFSPALYKFYERQGNIVVLIDIIRATTVICKALHQGANCIVPVAGVDEAFALKSENTILAGERNGNKIDGFDLGNSPYEFVSQVIASKDIVLTTTNGIQAIQAVNPHFGLYFAACANFTVITRFLARQKKDILLVCSGWKNKMNIEDTIFAGELASSLISSGRFYTTGDSVAISNSVRLAAKGNELFYIIDNSPRLRKKIDILGNDIRYALQYDTCPVIPCYHDRKILKFQKSACL